MEIETNNEKHFSPNEIPPINHIEDDGEYTHDVGVVINGSDFKGYVDVKTKQWWIDYGGISVGNRLTDTEEIDYWYTLKKGQI